MRRPLLASTPAVALLAGMVGAALPHAAHATPTPAQALLHQAEYWRSHGRPDISRQALSRLLILQPGDPVVRNRLQALPEAPRAHHRKRPPPPRPPSLTAHAFQALDRGDLGAAERLFQGALTANPHDANALGGLGLVRLKAERFDEAGDLLAQAMAAAGDAHWAAPLASARFYSALQKAQTARDTGDMDGADQIAQQLAASDYADRGLAQDLAADIAHRRAENDSRAALAAWRAGDAQGADDAFRKAVSRAPDDPWIRYGYAGFLNAGRRLDEAWAVMRPLAGATSPDARYATALFLDGAGRPGEAADALDAIAPADRSADMRRFERQLRCELAVRAARALGQVGRSRLAVAGLHRLADEPDLPTAALSQLADGLFELGDAPGATRLVDRALAQPRSAPSDYEGAVSVLARAGRSGDAQTLIAALAAASDGPQAQAQIVRLRARAALGAADRYSNRGELDQAIGVLRAQLAETLDDPELLSALGRAYLSAGRAGRAMQVFDALTRLRPQDEGAWRGLTAAALEARDLPVARRALARARDISPNDPAIVLASAELDRAMGENRAAVTELRTAVAAHERARAGDLDGLLDANVVRRTQAVFEIAAVAPDASDPAGDRLREQLDRAYEVASPSLQPRLGWANRSGEAGLSRLETTSAALAGGVPVGRGRFEFTVQGERLDAGAMSAAGAARFGAGPLAPAAGPTPKTRVDGSTVEVAYAAGDLRLGLGLVDFANRPAEMSGELRWTPKLAGDLQAEVAVTRRPVTESLVAYAGTTDPRAQVGGGAAAWGQVSRAGAQGGLTLTRRDLGAYAVLAAFAYDGRNVRANDSAQLDIGGYAHLLGRGATTLMGGLNLDLQAYRHNENAFTYGHGGYFSPQQFVSLTAPLHLRSTAGPWRLDARVSPGYARYREGDAPVFPTSPAWQARLRPDQSMVIGARKQGLGVSGEAKVEYALGPRLLIGAEFGGDTFGAYRESHAGLRVRLRFAGAP